MFVIVPMCLGIFVVAKEVIYIYAGDKYMTAVIPLMIACITRIFISLESVMNNLVMYPNDLENRISNDTILISVNAVNSELGILQPLKEISNIVKKYNKCYFHSDITQAIGKIDIDIKDIDLVSFSISFLVLKVLVH